MANHKKKLTTALKIIVSAVLIYFIFTKIEFVDVWQTVKKGSFFYLFFALLCFVISKVTSAYRLNLYLPKIGIPLAQKSNLQLALLGMFYNLFLPGGIGGDAYKGYVIQKKFQKGTKRTVSVLVLDRLSGLLLLFDFACILALFIRHEYFTPYRYIFLGALGLSILVFWYLNKRFFGYVLSVFPQSLLYSAVVQGTQLIAVFFILKALHIENHQFLYLFIFLVSSIVAVVPLTLGGIGSREVTFLYGSQWFGLNEDISVAVSLVFFAITALVSLFGIYFHFKKPALETL